MRTAIKPALATVLAVFSLAACDSSTGPEGGSALTLWVAGGPSGTGGGALSTVQLGNGADLVQTDGTHTLELTRVAVVVREIELERISDDDCEALSSGGSDDDDCEEFVIGPLILELPLDGSINQVITATVPADTYDELEFEIHKPEDDTPEDLAFIQANPEFRDVSIRVEGRFDGQAFVFTQDLNEDQELELIPPLVVSEETGPVELTLVLDVSTWFVRSNGSLIDPRTALKGQPNEDVVEDNIERSIDIYDD